MSNSDTFFVIQSATEIANGGMRLAGHLILDGRINVPGDSCSQPDNDPQFSMALPKPLEVKWILPPRNSVAYDAIKAFAEGAGYETVEHDDFSYPPRRN